MSKVVFRDVGTINEPVAACLQRAADHIKWEAQHARHLPKHDLLHASLVQAQARVANAIVELRAGAEICDATACERAIALLTGGAL